MVMGASKTLGPHNRSFSAEAVVSVPVVVVGDDDGEHWHFPLRYYLDCVSSPRDLDS